MSRPEQNSFQTLVTLEDNYLTSKNIDLLDAAISAHEDALHTLTRNLALLKNHRNSLSATWRLPIEVISRIMFVATQLSIKEINESDVYPPPQRIPVPLILGQICSAWRCLAWRLPELWATIPLAVSRSRYDTQIALLDDWLGRAGEIQDLSIILTLAHDDSELYHFQNCPPRAVLEKLYKRSHQWHTFYSTLPNLCFQDLFKGVYGNLGRLDTLVLNRSGRSPFQVGLGNVIHVNTGGLHSLGGQGPNVVVQAGPSVNGVFVNGVMVDGETHGGPPNGQGILPIHLPTTNTSSPSPPKIKSPWFMLSKTPSLKTVILPESLSPFDIPLPWVNLTYLELRTVSLSDCLHVLSCTPRMTSFTFHGIFSPSSINISFVNLSTTFSSSSSSSLSTTSGHRHLQCQRIQLNELRHFSVFSDHVNLSRFLNALVTPVLCAFGFKCTTGAIGGVLTEITKLGERSGWHELYDDDDRHHAGRLKKLEICVPSVGVAEETIVGWLMSPFDARSRIDVSSGSGDDDAITARIQNMIEELVLESWQVDVAGLSDSFLIKMNPERRVRWIKPYSYPLDNLRPGPPVEQLTSSPSCSTSVLSTRPGIASDQAAIPVNVPTRRDEDEGDEGDDDEIRDVVEQVVQISLGGSVPLHEVLLPNLTAMTYRGALSFTPKVLKETIYARWNRKRRTRTRGVPKPMTINADHSGIGSGIQIVGKGKERMDTAAAAAAAAAVEKEEKEKEEEEEEEEYFPTAELKAFDVRAPEMAVEDLKELIDEETKLAFREMLREGFCLSVETKKGLMAF